MQDNNMQDWSRCSVNENVHESSCYITAQILIKLISKFIINHANFIRLLTARVLYQPGNLLLSQANKDHHQSYSHNCNQNILKEML